MGHLIFIILHILAVMFGFVLLFITVPLHLIYTGTRKKKATLAGRMLNTKSEFWNTKIF